MVRVTIAGRTVALSRASGKTTTCTAEVSTLGKMGASMRVSTSMTESTALVPTSGKMAASTLANGPTANSTERASTDMPMGRKEKADGKRERESAGWMELKELLARLRETWQFDRFSARMKIICAYFKFE
jgi:hypothetical protein